MTYSKFDPAAQNRVPWNFGAKIGPKRPFNQKQIWAIRFFLDREQRVRDRALFDMAIDSKLCGCDLVELKIGDLVSGPEVRTRATITQRKTGRPVQFEIAKDARDSLFAWLELRGGSVEDYVFPSRVDHSRHLSKRTSLSSTVDDLVHSKQLRCLGRQSLIECKQHLIIIASSSLKLSVAAELTDFTQPANGRSTPATTLQISLRSKANGFRTI